MSLFTFITLLSALMPRAYLLLQKFTLAEQSPSPTNNRVGGGD